MNEVGFIGCLQPFDFDWNLNPMGGKLTNDLPGTVLGGRKQSAIGYLAHSSLHNPFRHSRNVRLPSPYKLRDNDQLPVVQGTGQLERRGKGNK